jgi:DNA repair protein RadC
MAKLKDYRHEVFAVVFLNRANKINHFEIVSEGGITGTVADPRIILKKALEEDAVSIILCHNHPSGSLKPSRADEELTLKIKEAAKYFDIKVLDHMIVSDHYFSFADEGLLNPLSPKGN